MILAIFAPFGHGTNQQLLWHWEHVTSLLLMFSGSLSPLSSDPFSTFKAEQPRSIAPQPFSLETA